MEWNGPARVANDLVQTVENLGYGVRPYDVALEKEQLDKEERFLLLCLGVAGFAMGNIMLVSVGLWTTNIETMGTGMRDFMHWVSALIAIPTVLYSGRPFFRSAFAALKAGQTNMDVPISVGLTLAGAMSLFETVNHGEHAYFDSAVMLIFFLLIGRYFDFRARKKARSSAGDLLASLSGFVTVLEGEKPRHVLARDVVPGQILLVAAGEKFPVDGVILEGESDVDISLITGETIPAAVSPDSEVYAGTINLSAPVRMQITKITKDSLLADIARLLDKASQAQARYVRIADKVARLYTPVVHILALAAFLAWWGTGLAWQESLIIAITVLIITCPCALGLAVPVVQVLATDRLMQRGILVKSGDALERLAAIDTIFMDKTGTLTLGKPALIQSCNEEHLRLAASLAAHSIHPLSLAITKSYGGALLPLSNIREYPGCGMEGYIGDERVRLGSRNWCGDKSQPVSSHLELWLEIAGKRSTPFYFSDQLRPDALETLNKFRQKGISIILLSGDRETIVQNMAKEAGIEQFYAELSPSQKFEMLEKFKRQGHKILMVGDGLNDAPTLAGANISMAPGTAVAISQNAADIVFMGDKLLPVYQAYETACRTQKIVRQNFILAILYNIVAIPVAALGYLTPLLAALAMSGSSLVVILNSFRMRRKA